MSPTMLLKNNEVKMVLGTPGGSTIFTSVFQTIVNILDFKMTPLEAVGSTRFHHQLLPPDLVTYSVTRPLADETIRAWPRQAGNTQYLRRSGQHGERDSTG